MNTITRRCRRIVPLSQEEQGSYRVVFVTCSFARASLDLKLVFDSERKVAGMVFLPSQASGAAADWSPPPFPEARK